MGLKITSKLEPLYILLLIVAYAFSLWKFWGLSMKETGFGRWIIAFFLPMISTALFVGLPCWVIGKTIDFLEGSRCPHCSCFFKYIENCNVMSETGDYKFGSKTTQVKRTCNKCGGTWAFQEEEHWS